MFTHKVNKAVPRKVNRSGFHQLVISGRHVKRTAEAEGDIFGAVMVVLLTAAVVFLMRIVLAK